MHHVPEKFTQCLNNLSRVLKHLQMKHSIASDWHLSFCCWSGCFIQVGLQLQISDSK